MWFEVFVGCVIEWSKPPLSGAHVPAVPRYHRFRKIPKIGPEKKFKKKYFAVFELRKAVFIYRRFLTVQISKKCAAIVSGKFNRGLQN